MPVNNNPLRPFSQFSIQPLEPQFEGGVFSAAMRQENAPFNVSQGLADSLDRYGMEPQMGFDLPAKLSAGGPLAKEYPEAFRGVQSDAEFNFQMDMLKRRKQDELQIASNGVLGVVSSIAAGTLSPTVLIPVVGGMGTAARVASIVGGSVLGAAIDEVALQANNPARTQEQMNLAVGGAFVVGSILGGASAFVSAAGKVRAGKAIEAIAAPEEGRVVSRAEFELIIRRSEAAGAQVTNPEISSGAQIAGQTKAGRALGYMSPPLNVQQAAADHAYGLDSAAQASSNISTSGVKLAPKKDAGSKLGMLEAVAEGGQIEHLVLHQTRNHLTTITKVMDEQFNLYLSDGVKTGKIGNLINNARSSLGIKKNPGEMAWQEWNKELHRAMSFGDESAIPSVQKTAQELRKVIDDITRQMQEVELLPAELTQEMLKGGRLSYLTDVYDHMAIRAQGPEFEQLLRLTGQKTMDDTWAKRWLKVETAIAGDLQQAADLAKTGAEVEVAKTQIKQDIVAMSTGDHAQAVNEVAVLQREARQLLKDAKAEPDFGKRIAMEHRAAELKDNARALRAANPEIKAFQREKAALNRRLTTFNGTIYALAEKQAKLIERADAAWNEGLNTLSQMSNKISKLRDKLDTLTDENFDGELAGIVAQINHMNEVWERGEASMAKLAAKFPELVDAPDELLRRVQRYREDVFAGLSRTGPDGEKIPLIETAKHGEKILAIRSAEDQAAALARVDDFLARPEPWAEVPGTPAVPGGPVALISSKTKRDPVKGAETVLNLSNGESITIYRDTDQFSHALWHAELPGGGQPEWARNGLGYTKQEAIAYVLKQGKQAGTPEVPATRTKNPKGWLDPETPITPAMRKGMKEFRDEIAGMHWSDSTKLAAAEVKLDRMLERQTNRSARLADKLTELRKAKEIDREALRVTLDDLIEEGISKAHRVNSKRAIREAKLRERASKVGLEDMPNVTNRMDVLNEAPATRREAFIDQAYRAGATNVDPENGVFDFGEALALEAAQIRNKILGDDVRSVGIDIVKDRGPVLARMLDIPYEDKVKFLVTDVNRITKAWVRTAVPDVELTRRFGDSNMSKWLGTKDELGKIDREAATYRQHIQDDLDKKGQPLEKPRTVAEKEKLQLQLERDRREAKRLLKVQLDRVRNMDGHPQNPDAIAYRFARSAMAANVPIYLGNTAIASLSDIGRPIMKYGMQNAFKESFLPMITSFKEWAGEMAGIARSAGRVNEDTMSSRLMAMGDVVESNQRYTSAEAFIEMAANSMGKVSGIDYFTNLGQMFTAPLANAEFMHALETVMSSTKRVPMDKAVATLANAGFSEQLAKRLWRELERGGFKRFSTGTLAPAVDEWVDQGVKRAYLAHISKEIDSTIVVPGQERPAFSTSNIGWRLINQFRSFGWAMQTKGLAAGLQQRDMAVAQGLGMMMAMGATSYYFWALQHGTESQQFKDMMNATPGKWMDEMIYRSGALAAFQDLQSLLSDFDLTHGLVNFSSDGAERLRGRDFRETLLGVSMGTANNIQQLVGGIDDPTLSTAHAARKLMFYNNVTYLRWIFTQAEKATGLPEDRR